MSEAIVARRPGNEIFQETEGRRRRRRRVEARKRPSITEARGASVVAFNKANESFISEEVAGLDFYLAGISFDLEFAISMKGLYAASTMFF